MEFTPRFLSVPADHFFLLGPRGTGKTSWTQSLFPDALRIDLLDPATLRDLSAKPERLRERIEGCPGLKSVLVDEVQKLPQLLEVIHALIEEKRGIQFILTGSSARKLRRTGVNLLGGRAAQKRLHPYMAAELGDRFRLDEALKPGEPQDRRGLSSDSRRSAAWFSNPRIHTPRATRPGGAPEVLLL